MSLRSIYRVSQGPVTTRKRETKATRHYNYETQLVKDCLNQLDKRNKVVSCYNQEQLDSIIDVCQHELEFKWNDKKDECRIWKKK